MRTALIGAAGVVLIGLILFVVVGLMAGEQVTVQHRRFIAAEPQEVFEVVSDHDAWPELLGEGGAITEVSVEGAGDAVGTERLVRFDDGTVWEDMISVYEPPYDLRFSGVTTPGVRDWQNHILLEPGARGGTVATFRVSFNPEGFARRAASEVYFDGIVRQHAISFLENTAERLGVRNVNVDEYVLRQAQKRARDQYDAENGDAPDPALEAPEAQGDAEGGPATPTGTEGDTAAEAATP